ncbi:probable beta-D-xylosidase 6 isoform X2 [Salvia splendens]|uniref:probable beta-D-xylosidase 6 isoform X2 n=1 Tax=Salvia splendens TaxID=180675 RepID=UPI001C25A03D|nr:probable beta-D-xylosidase 6 isoform X2 [Salvia splendens]
MGTALVLFVFLFLLQLTCQSHSYKRPCQPPHHHSYPFCNTSLPLKSRAHSLISLLTLPEKIQQLSNNASAVPRLGIPSYQWWSESLHGIASNGPGVSFNGSISSATVFPQVILASSAFNRSLWAALAAAIAVEATAMHNSGLAGLTYWAPNINIFRDPRWGRGQETPGEDPLLTSSYAVEYVTAFQGGYYRQASGYNFGMQRRVLGDDGDEMMLSLSACCKHFTAYDLEKWGQFSRYNFNAVVTEQDMEDTYQAPFRSCILQGNASCLMCSYNSINGVPACANRHLLQKARSDWNFRGYITSDCDAVATIYEYQNYTKTAEDAVADALKAGTDINCGTYMLRHMMSAFEQGKVSEENIHKALLNLFLVQLRLGLFDGEPARNRFRKLGPKDVCSEEHRKLALEATQQGIVLLKNEQKLLPLNKHGVSSLALIGPLANSTDLGGGYTGVPCNPISIMEGLKGYVKDIYHAAGCQDVSCNSTVGFVEALSAARQSDYVIVVAGIDLSQETEDHDRYSLLLPGYQIELVTAVAVIGSILWIGYPGETGGTALSEIIFGNYNPGGRLTMTWYPESFTRVPMNDMNMRADPSRGYPGRTYRFYTGDRVFGFGYGLSYTSFTYKLTSAPLKLSLPVSIPVRRKRNLVYKRGNDDIYVDEVPYCSSLRFEVKISVTNGGDVDGSEVVLLFAKSAKKLRGSPEMQLVGFERVHILQHETAETRFVVDPCDHLSFADEDGNRVLPTGDHLLISKSIEHVVSIEIS